VFADTDGTLKEMRTWRLPRYCGITEFQSERRSGESPLPDGTARSEVVVSRLSSRCPQLWAVLANSQTVYDLYRRLGDAGIGQEREVSALEPTGSMTSSQYMVSSAI